MLFGGAQYEDEGAAAAAATPQRRKKAARASAKGPARRGDKRSSASASAAANANAAPGSLARSYESTASSSGNSLSSYSYMSHAAGLSASAVNPSTANSSSNNAAAASPPRPMAMTMPTAPKPQQRRLREVARPVRRSIAAGIFKLKRPVDRQGMYPGVWKALKFRKKMVQLASSLSVKPICVTGVDGFLASWIVSELLSRGYRVRGTVQNRKDDISGLLQLPNAARNFTVVETSLLTPEACDMAVQGCDFVIHTGTPSSCSVRDPLSEQQEPGVHSIGSRMHCIIPMMTNFIQACARARIKRVVLTSSIAAMADSVGPDSIINDANWNTTSSLERNPHFLSLKLAEEAAWQLVDQLPRDRKIDLVTMNPGTLFGPALSKSKLSPGNQIIYDLIMGQYSALVDLNWSLIDVRDCAAAHIAALENNDARGRYICVNRSVWMREIVDILSKNGYSGRDLPWRVGLPAWVGRLPAYSLQLGQVGAALYVPDPTNPRSSPYLSDKVVEHLNINFRSVGSSIVESANDLLKWGLIKPWAEDHEALACGCCQQQFTFYRRKHHCRECGVIICNDCSMSRAVIEGSDGRARLCDKCVKVMVPDLLVRLRNGGDDASKKRLAVAALESLMENPLNHDYVTRFGGILLLMDALHDPDESISARAAGALCALTLSVASTLQMVLEGAVLQMLEVDETISTWAICLQALRNIWKHINRQDFRRMLHAVARVSADADIGELRGNILLTFVHMMDATEVPTLLSEGLLSVLHHMLQSPQEFPRCAAAHAIKHLVPPDYDPDLTIDVPPYVVDDHEELFLNASLSDLQFLVKGHIAPINAHKVVLFFRNSYFKNMVRFGSATSQTAVIEVENCSYEVFSILLRFLYTGKVDITPDIAEELLRASSFYCVLELQKRCEAFLSNQIDVDNVVGLLSLADESGAADLKKNCVPFLMRHIHEVVRLPAFEMHRVRSSEEVLKALVTILGDEWETSYEALKATLGSTYKPHKVKDEEPTDSTPPTSSPREPPTDVHLSPKFLLSPVAPRSFGNHAAFTGEMPMVTPVAAPLDPVGENASQAFSFVKPFGNEDVMFRRSRGLSEDFSEGLSEGVC